MGTSPFQKGYQVFDVHIESHILITHKSRPPFKDSTAQDEQKTLNYQKEIESPIEHWPLNPAR